MTLDYKVMDNEYCVKLATQHGDGAKIELINGLDNHLVVGYDVYYKGTRRGVVFSMKVGDFYTLDGYQENTGKEALIIALKAGRKVMDELFDNYTALIITKHKESEKNLTALCEKLGFVEQSVVGKDIILAAGKTVPKTIKRMLLLSGGKDSCSLAFKLDPETTLAFTYDNGLLSDVAKDNISKVLEKTKMRHVYWRANNYAHQVFIGRFLNDNTQTMKDVCSKCSAVLQDEALSFAKKMGIPKIYAGFTSYTIEIHGGNKEEEYEIDGIKIVNPYKNKYSVKEITEQLGKEGVITDPLKTNCIFIKKIIEEHTKRHGDNPFKREADLLLADSQIDKEEYNYYIKE